MQSYPHHHYRPTSKTLHEYLELLVELNVTHVDVFRKKEKQQILMLIASNKSDFDFSEAIQQMLAENLDKESDKRPVFLRLIAEFVFYNGFLGFSTMDDKATKTSEELIDYFSEELFDVFKNRIQCAIYKIEEQFELLREQAHYESLSWTQKRSYDAERLNEYGVNEANFH